MEFEIKAKLKYIYDPNNNSVRVPEIIHSIQNLAIEIDYRINDDISVWNIYPDNFFQFRVVLNKLYSHMIVSIKVK